MGLLNKLGIGTGGRASRNVSRPTPTTGSTGNQRGGASPVAVGSARGAEAPETNRVSNGLKEFLWNLDGLGRGTLLDLGPAWQTTLNFFIERGFRVSSEDILRGWKAFLTEEETWLRDDAGACETLDMTPSGRATRFLLENLQ